MSEKFAFPWEKLAASNSPMPDGLDLPNQMAYAAMRNIYYSFKNKLISKEQAAEEKRKLKMNYEKMVETIAFEMKLAKHMCDTFKATEHYRAEVRKNPTPENALKLADAIDGKINMEVVADAE